MANEAVNIRPDDYCTGMVLPRIPGESVYQETTGQVPVTQEIVNRLNNATEDPKVKMMHDIGVRITGYGDAEVSDNVPRMFILQPSANNPAQDEAKDLLSAGIRFGSLEFWKEVQKGNVFAYPVGKANPVQLRLDTSVPGQPVFGYSKPIDPEDIPLREKPVPDPEPTRPNRLTMWLNRTFGWFKGTVDDFNNRVQAYNDYQQRRTSLLDPIRQQVERRNSGHRLSIETTQAKDRLYAIDNAIKPSRTVDVGEPMIRELYGTKPVRRKEFTKDDLPEDDKPRSKYTKEEFDELKPIDIDLDSIKIGNSGVSVNDEDFAALSMFAATQYKHMKTSLDKHPLEASWMIDDLKAFEIQDPEQRRADSMNTMVAMDIVRDETGPRENIGMFFKDVFQPAREEVKTTLENYKEASSVQNAAERKALKEGLGAIIAGGINCVANFVKEKDTLSHQDRLMACEAGRLIRLMDQDPELRTIAQEKGLDQEKLKAVKGILEYDKIAREKDSALKELKTAAAYGKPLTDQQKKDFAKKITKANTFEALFKNGHNVNCEKGDYKRLYDKLMNFDNQMMAPMKKNPDTGASVQLPWSECPPPKAGKVYMGSPVSKIESALKIEKLPEPEIAVLMSNPKGQKWLDEFAQSQVEQMNLGEMDAYTLDNRLKNDLESNKLANEGAVSMLKFAAQGENEAEKQYVPEPQAQKDIEINPVPALG